MPASDAPPSPADLAASLAARSRLDGRVAIVTGASAGLGERFARVLHAIGATVVLAARRQDRLEALTAQLPGSSFVVADITKAEDREAVVATTLERHGRVDVLVNNAGIGYLGGVEQETLEQFREVMELNVTAAWHLAKLAGADMVARGSGSIVNIASIAGVVSLVPLKQANYAASKGALVNLTRDLAAQWARKGVRVNALAPGWFPSEATAAMFDDPASMRYVQTNCPMGRFGEIDELDGALVLLATDLGSYLTGHVLLVDGGWTAR